MILNNEHLLVKICGLKGVLCDSQCHSMASMMRIFFFFYFLPFPFLVNFILQGRGSPKGKIRGQRADRRG